MADEDSTNSTSANETQPTNTTENTNNTKPNNHTHSGPIDDEEEELDNPLNFTDARVEYYLNAIRGFWTGYMRGFYKDSKMGLNSRCMSSDLSNSLFFLVDFMEGHQPLWKVVSFVTTFAKIFNDNNENCGY